MRLRYYIATDRRSNIDGVGQIFNALSRIDTSARLNRNPYGPAEKPASPSGFAQESAQRYQAVDSAHAVIVTLPAGRHALIEMGVALGLGRKVFVHARKREDLRNAQDDVECAHFHLGHREDEGTPPLHPSDPEIVIGDQRVLAERVTTWWAGYQVAVLEGGARCSGVTLHFQGRGRYWSSAMKSPESVVVLGQDYDGPDPHGGDDRTHVGSRHAIVVDKGKCPPIPDEHLTAALQLLGVAPVGADGG